MNFLKQLVCVFSILLCIISCDIITQNNEDGNIDWSKGDYAFIEMENYPEWESGIITKDHNYLLTKIDTSNNGYIGYINSQAFESDGIALFFDEDLELQSFATKKGVCYINRNEEQLASLLLVIENENTIFDNIELPSRSTNYAPTNKIETRSSSNLSIIKGVAEGVSDLLDIVDLKEGTEQLLDGNWNDSSLNFLEILAGSAIKDPFKGLALDALFKNLEEAKKAFDQMGQIIFLGDCQIAIRQTKIGLKNFKLDVTVSGFESLPPVNFKNGQTKSIVLAGIAINQLPHMTYSANERIIQTWVVDGNGTKSFEFELPKEVTYYATPYLLPTDGKTRFASNIRYGNTIKLHYFNGFIDEFKQQSYSENGDKYTFNCNAHAICNTKDGQYWKLYYENNTGWKEFFEAKTYDDPSISSSNSAEFDFEIELSTDLFDDKKEDIKLGIAIFDSSHQMLIASDPQIFELSTDCWVDLGLPSGILWAAYNVGATSPEEYGNYYAWGETKEKSSYTWQTYSYAHQGYDEWGYPTVIYENIGSQIHGTQYDVATKLWEEGARMPTKNEFIELTSTCTFTRSEYNNVSGFSVIGPNGNQIFLPFTGVKGYGEHEGRNTDGYFWSATIETYGLPDWKEELDDAFYLYLTPTEKGGYNIGVDGGYEREYGITIRPVKEPESEDIK